MKGPWFSQKFFLPKLQLNWYCIWIGSKKQGPFIDKTTTVRPQYGLSRSDFEISIPENQSFVVTNKCLLQAFSLILANRWLF